MTQSKQWVFPWKKWWIFPLQKVAVYQRVSWRSPISIFIHIHIWSYMCIHPYTTNLVTHVYQIQIIWLHGRALPNLESRDARPHLGMDVIRPLRGAGRFGLELAADLGEPLIRHPWWNMGWKGSFIMTIVHKKKTMKWLLYYETYIFSSSMKWLL